MPGDWPDPSVLRDGRTYWAVVTSADWRPPFTLLRSRDLVNWRVAGSVLPRTPRWASGRFWAPELVRWGRRYLVYYTAARARDGRLCVGVATSRSPRRPFRDRGVVQCPRGGAIDPLPVRDEAGRPHLLWKPDVNRYGGITSILAQPLGPDGLRVTGPPRELIRADLPWERRIVEAPEIVRRGSAWYLLYSANLCCGPPCRYAVGAARAPSLLGPWVKRPDPVLSGSELFRCPGHGSAVTGPAGGSWLLYHAMPGGQDLGRSLFLDRLTWDSQGWPVVGRGVPSRAAPSPAAVTQRPRRRAFRDGFSSRRLRPGWQWPFGRPRVRVRRGLLRLRSGGQLAPAIVGRQPGAEDYTVTASVGRRGGGARPGLGALADADSAIGIELRGRRVVVWRRDGLLWSILARARAPRGRVELRMVARGGRGFTFSVRRRGRWRVVGQRRHAAPPWNGEVRAILRVAGSRRARAAFGGFGLR